MDISEYIKPEFLVMAPVLYILGAFIKKSALIKDNFIPITLSAVSVFFALIYVVSVSEISGLQSLMGAIFTALTQGFLVAGATVLCNQIKKQNDKKSGDNDDSGNDKE